MSFLGDLFYPDNPRRRSAVNSLQRNILRIASDTEKLIQSHNEMLARYETLHGANVTLLGRPLPALGYTAIEVQRVPRADGAANDSTAELFDSVQSILGPIPWMGLYEGKAERSALEEAIGRLDGIRRDLDARCMSIAAANAMLSEGILQAVHQFNQILCGLAKVVAEAEPTWYQIEDPMQSDAVVEAQRQLISTSGRYVQATAFFRKRWSEDVALGKEPPLEARNAVYQDLVSYGLLSNLEEGERMYQVMCALDREIVRGAPGTRAVLRRA